MTVEIISCCHTRYQPVNSAENIICRVRSKRVGRPRQYIAPIHLLRRKESNKKNHAPWFQIGHLLHHLDS